MLLPLASPVLFVLPLLVGGDLPSDTGPDAAPRLLAARAEARSGTGAPATGGGNRLFRMSAPDNAACVRAVGDVTGDGLDEVIAGIDESGVDNVFCLDGASSGVATVFWKIQTTDGVSGGSPYGDDSIVPISDSDGNGHANLLVGTAWGGRTAYNLDALDGTVQWKFDTYLTANSGWVYSLCELSDVNGDGVPECAFGVGSNSDSVYLVDGASIGGGQASVRWRYAAGDVAYAVRNLGDVNGDGYDDVLAAVGDNVDELVCLDGGTANPLGHVLWRVDPAASVWSCGVVADLTGDGVAEALAVLWTTDGSAIRCLNGATGAAVWSSSEVYDYAMMVDPLADVTGDGVPEVVVSSWENAVLVLDGADGSLLWKTVVGTVNGGDVWTARAIDDLNGDGRQDVIAGSFDYHVYALDGDTGEVFWSFATNNRIYSVYPVGDLNGDGTPDVVAGTQDTNNQIVVHVLEGDAGIPFPNLTLRGTGALGSTLEVEIVGQPGALAIPAASLGTASINVPPFGTLGLAPPLTWLPAGPVSAAGVYETSTGIPNDPLLAGLTAYVQGLVATFGPSQGSFTDVESIDLH